jgi:hypothetical protein
MNYESVEQVESKVAAGVTFLISRMSFARRMDLMKRVRDLAREATFRAAGRELSEQMSAALLEAEIQRLYVKWGLISVDGLEIDGCPATPESLAQAGPEELFREAYGAVRAATGLSEEERKN